MTVYDNDDGETFWRESDICGHTGRYDVARGTKEELDGWLAAHGFRIVGYEPDENGFRSAEGGR